VPSIPTGPLSIPVLTQTGEHRLELSFAEPGSKSNTNRALILAALAGGGPSRLRGVLHSDDTRHMRAALEALGIGIADEAGATVRVEGGRERLHPPRGEIFVGNSGTTVRFVAALAGLVDGDVTLSGDAAMARRPIQDLVEGLRQLGVAVDCPTGCPPLTLHGGRLRGGRVRMRGDRSSQYFSALMMAASLAEGDVTIDVEGTLVSRPYVDITARMIADFGGAIEGSRDAPGGGDRFVVRSRPSLTARDYAIEPDASSASYPFALAAACGGKITVPGLGRGTVQGDYRFVDVLAAMGARVSATADATTVEGTEALRGVDVDMHHISDTVMTLAAIAPVCLGATTIRNVANIRIKETDRLAATVAELRRLGQRVEHGDDWLRIEPAPIQPATVRSYADHRMAMSFAVLGAARPGITIEDPACVSKTYPGFWHDLAACYPPDRRPAW
jgi:3-phosphoshikimate 1-carboxyvinyltransferase